MLWANLLLTLSCFSSIGWSQEFATTCCDINADSVVFATRAEWCGDQVRTCANLCADGGAGENNCDSTDLSFVCKCNTGLPGGSGNFSDFSETIPSFQCNEWHAQCSNRPPTPDEPDPCAGSLTCGSRNAQAYADEVAKKASEKPQEHKRTLSAGAIAGVVIGAVMAVLLAIGIAWWLRRRKHTVKQREVVHEKYEDENNQPGLEVGDRTTGRQELSSGSKKTTRSTPAPTSAEVLLTPHELPEADRSQQLVGGWPSCAGDHQQHQPPTAPITPPAYEPRISSLGQAAPELPERAEHEFVSNPMPERVAEDVELMAMERELQETRAQMERLHQLNALNQREQQLREAIERRRAGNR